jgi:hypothetical protein
LFGQFGQYLDSSISSCGDQDRESTFLVNEGATFCEMPDYLHQEQPEVSQSSSTSVSSEDPTAFAISEYNNFSFDNMGVYPTSTNMMEESTDNPGFDMTEILLDFPMSVYFSVFIRCTRLKVSRSFLQSTCDLERPANNISQIGLQQ